MERRLDIFKAFAVLTRGEKKGASYKDIAPLAGVDETTASACLKFWYSIGLLEKQDIRL